MDNCVEVRFLSFADVKFDTTTLLTAVELDVVGVAESTVCLVMLDNPPGSVGFFGFGDLISVPLEETDNKPFSVEVKSAWKMEMSGNEGPGTELVLITC